MHRTPSTLTARVFCATSRAHAGACRARTGSTSLAIRCTATRTTLRSSTCVVPNPVAARCLGGTTPPSRRRLPHRSAAAASWLGAAAASTSMKVRGGQQVGSIRIAAHHLGVLSPLFRSFTRRLLLGVVRIPLHPACDASRPGQRRCCDGRPPKLLVRWPPSSMPQSHRPLMRLPALACLQAKNRCGSQPAHSKARSLQRPPRYLDLG